VRYRLVTIVVCILEAGERARIKVSSITLLAWVALAWPLDLGYDLRSQLADLNLGHLGRRVVIVYGWGVSHDITPTFNRVTENPISDISEKRLLDWQEQAIRQAQPVVREIIGLD